MRSIIATGIIALAAVGLTACSSDDSADATTTSTTSAPATTAQQAQAATYTLRENGKDEYIATVTTADTTSLGMAWSQIRKSFVDGRPEGGYFVRFDCATPAADQSPRIANAKVAVGRLGAAQTGLTAGKGDIQFVDGARCGTDPGYQSQVDRKATLDAAAVNDLCREFIEEKYTVEQLPVTITNASTTEADGKWTATGTAKGASKYGTDAATVNYTCTVQNNTGTMLRKVELR